MLTLNVFSFAWKRVGEIRFPLAAASEDAMLEAAIEAGCDDCAVEDEQHVVTCEMGSLAGAAQELSKAFGDPAQAKFVWRTEIVIPVEGDAAEQLMIGHKRVAENLLRLRFDHVQKLAGRIDVEPIRKGQPPRDPIDAT